MLDLSWNQRLKWRDFDGCTRMKTNMLRGSPVAQRWSIRLLTNLKTVESAPLIPKKHRFSGPSLEPSWNQITANELPALPDAAVCQPLAVHC